MLPVPKSLPIDENSNHRSNRKASIQWVLIAIVVAGVVAYGVVHSIKSSKAPDIVIHTDNKPTDNAYGISVGITDIIISRKWSVISGNHPTITFKGFATSRSKKLQYVCFVYRPLNDPIWTSIDARRLKDGSYQAKIRDARHDTDYMLYISGVTKDHKYSCQPMKIHIP